MLFRSLIERGDANLSFAVVSEIGSLENRRAAEIGDGARELIGSGHGAERSMRKASIGQECFLADAMLRGVQDLASRTHGRLFSSRGRGRRRNIFEFECNDADTGSESADGVKVVVGRDDFEVGYLASGGVGVGGKSVDAIAHAAGGDREHAPELSASEDAESGARKDGFQ